MSVRSKISLILFAVVANLAVFWWRLSRAPEPVSARPHKPVPLAQEPARIVLQWRRTDSIPLTAAGIGRYVSQMSWQGCVQAPSGVEVVSEGSLEVGEQLDLQQAVQGLITAYTAGSAEALLNYMSERGQKISPAMVEELKKLLIVDGGLSESSLELLDSQQIFVTFAEKASYNPHWSALIEGTACAVIWKLPQQGPQETPKNLGGDYAGLFKNQTRFHHLFVTTEADEPEANSHDIYADVRFVIEHDQEFLREPSPYFVRYGYNRTIAKWQPLEMVHIATSSGNSPILLF